jgi:hypothetical protein
LPQEPQRQLQLDLAERQTVEGIIVETFGNDDRGIEVRVGPKTTPQAFKVSLGAAV